jgi:hypothetical protein
MKIWKVETKLMFHLAAITISCWNLLLKIDHNLNPLSIKVPGTVWLWHSPCYLWVAITQSLLTCQVILLAILLALHLQYVASAMYISK